MARRDKGSDPTQCPTGSRARLRIVVAAAAACLVYLGATGQGRGDGAGKALLARIIERHERFQTTEARFTQAYRSRVIRQERVEKGKLWIKRPGLMRWEYSQPPGKLYVINAKGSFLLLPDERQVWTGPPAKADKQSIVTDFLSGTLDPSSLDYDAVELTPDPGGGRLLQITPKHAEEFEFAIIHFDAGDLTVNGITVVDVLGNRTLYTFSDYKYDVPLDDALFAFEPPRGYEVIKDGL